MSIREQQLPRGARTVDFEVAPIPAASVMVLRDSPIEVLMIRRHEESSFAPGAWVFPGGAVDRADEELSRELGDGSALATMRIAAARELFEETGVWLGDTLDGAEQKRERLLAGSLSFRDLTIESMPDLGRLVWTSHWITPVGLPKRFDTWFFLAGAGDDAVATVEHNEAVEVLWISPAEALARHAGGRMPMVFPTVRNLEAIRAFATVREALESGAAAAIRPMLPRLVIEGERKKIVLDE